MLYFPFKGGLPGQRTPRTGGPTNILWQLPGAELFVDFFINICCQKRLNLIEGLKHTFGCILSVSVFPDAWQLLIQAKSFQERNMKGNLYLFCSCWMWRKMFRTNFFILIPTYWVSLTLCKCRSCMAALRRRWAGILGSPGRHFSSLTAAANLPAATSSNGANPDCPTAARVLRSPNG